MNITPSITPQSISNEVDEFFSLARKKVRWLARSWPMDQGAPVFTVSGRYSSRGWTDWTTGFVYGNALLFFEKTGETEFLKIGKSGTTRFILNHLTHTGVHDHGFTVGSSFGNLLRLHAEEKTAPKRWEEEYCRLAVRVSGAVQASRWTGLPGGYGYIFSFNGRHSLFIDTLRTLRILGQAHLLGHTLYGEQEQAISLLGRLIIHGITTAKYNLYYGEGRDGYDLPGRVVHEAVFNVESGSFRNPSTQQGYSPLSTWTRGLAWAVLGFAEELEFLSTFPESDFSTAAFPGNLTKKSVLAIFEKAGRIAAEFYIDNTPLDGIPYWDTGAPELHKLGQWREEPSDPFNPHEPVDSSAAAITAQGFLRLGRYLLDNRGSDPERREAGQRYIAAGLTLARGLFRDPYLSRDPEHQGLLLHALYHHPNGWDYIHPNQKVPNGESCMWGDYHAMELAVYLSAFAAGEELPAFWKIG